MEGFSAVRGSGFRVLADYLVIHNDKGEPGLAGFFLFGLP